MVNPVSSGADGPNPLVEQSQLGRKVTVVAASLVVAVLVSFVLALIETQLRFSLFGLYVLFIIPLGAFVAGMAAAGGYYFAARQLDIRPAGLLGLSLPALLGVVVYVLTHYLIYRRVGGGGGFLDFYQARLVNTQYGINSGSGRTVGGFGYLLALLEVVGTAAGSWGASALLAAKPYCDDCGRYLDDTGRDHAWFESREDHLAASQAVMGALGAGNESAAWSVLNSIAEPGRRRRAFQTSLERWGCPSCRRSWFTFKNGEAKGNNWSTTFEHFGRLESFAPQHQGNSSPGS